MPKNAIFNQLIINIIVPAVVAMVVLAVLNYDRLRTLLMYASNEKNEVLIDDVLYLIDYQELALNIQEDYALSRLKLISEELVQEVFKNTQNIENANLRTIRNMVGLDTIYEDIYIINRSGIIVNTTYTEDLGLNLFNFGVKHQQFLQSVWDSASFQSAGFTVESTTNRPRLYTYQPTQDGSYLVELGLRSPKAEKILGFINKRLSEISNNEHYSIRSVDIISEVDNNYYTLSGQNAALDYQLLAKLFEQKSDTSYVKSEKKNWHKYDYRFSQRQGAKLYTNTIIRIVSSLDSERKLLQRELIIFLLYFLLTVLVVIIFLYLKTKSIVAPINKLANSVNIYQKGDYKVRAEVVGQNEISGLARSFNSMLQTIEQHHNELEHKVRDRTREINQQKIILEQNTLEISLKNRRLEQLESIVKGINSEIDVNKLSQTIINNLKQIEGAESGAIYLFNKRSKNFKKLTGFGSQDNLETEISLPHYEQNYLQKCQKQDDAFYLNQKFEYAPGRQGSLLTIYLQVDNSIDGFLILENTAQTDAFSPNALQLLMQLREHIAAAFIKAMLLDELRLTLDELKTTQKQLIQQEKLASLGQLTAGIAHEIRNPLNFVSNFAKLSNELIEELEVELQNYDKLLQSESYTEITEISGMIKDNVGKIRKHSKRAEDIVTSMLSHSRQSTGKSEQVNFNNFVREYTNLAYQSMKIKYPDMQMQLIFKLAESALKTKLQPGEFSRVIINLVSNSCYALYQKKTNQAQFEPTLEIATFKHENGIVLTINDNGPGIPQQHLEKIFLPFFTTKPAGEGTGLGLSMSYEIVTQLHKGQMSVQSQAGVFTKFMIILPD